MFLQVYDEKFNQKIDDLRTQMTTRLNQIEVSRLECPKSWNRRLNKKVLCLKVISQDIRVIYIQTHQCLNYNYSLLARQHPPAAPLASLAKQSYYTYLLWRTKVDVLLIPDFGFCNIVIYTIELSL